MKKVTEELNIVEYAYFLRIQFKFFIITLYFKAHYIS